MFRNLNRLKAMTMAASATSIKVNCDMLSADASVAVLSISNTPALTSSATSGEMQFISVAIIRKITPTTFSWRIPSA